MTEKSKNLKKGIVSENDISTLLQRYSANTVLALLQEVAQFEGVKIDWKALVKKSTTGISNAREYQMLWRHLAYRHSMIERLDDEAQPLDDDSDLEYELEAFPSVSGEASAEASACVKVLIASGLTSDSSHTSNGLVEAPLTINIPNGQSANAKPESSQLPAMRGMNITVPVSVQKQSLHASSSAEQPDTNGLVNGTIPPRRKRKFWSEAEDLELLAAVQKYGEGNWANILRSEFTWERTASQLSQRWGHLRKRVGGFNFATASNYTGVQISEAQRAAQIALNLALDPPVKNSFINSGEVTQRSLTTMSSSTVQLGSAVKSQLTINKPVKPDLSLDPVKAAAVAAGARIASQSDAASLLKAAQAKNAIRVMPSVGSSVKQSLPSSSSTHKELHSNVNKNALQHTPVSNQPAVLSSGLSTPFERASTQSIPRDSASSSQSNNEIPPKQDIVDTGGISVAKVPVEEHGASVGRTRPSLQVKQEKIILPNRETEIKIEKSCGESMAVSPKLDVAEGSQTGDKVSCFPVEKDDCQRPIECQVNRLAGDKCGDKLELVDKKAPGRMSALTGVDS